MKTNKEDIQVLKSKHRIELVMQEAGEIFEVDSENSDHWRSTITPGLIVNIRRQIYEIKRPSMDIESGDLFTWLQRRYTWDFGKAIKFLQNRVPDPKRKAQPTKILKSKKKEILSNDFITISHEHIHPITGERSYSVNYNYEIMDDLQKRALETAGEWVIKYFTEKSDDIFSVMRNYPHRFKQITDFGIEKCAHCETPFKWQVPNTFAYAQEEERTLEVISDDKAAKHMETYEAVFVDADFVICEKCMRGKYAPRYKALKLAWRSALRRTEENESQRAYDREEITEEERDSVAEGKN